MNLQLIRGFPFPRKFEKEKILSALNYKPRDDDIIISSYPKTGTTWVQYIILQILHRAQVHPSFDHLTFKIAPYMEMAGAASVENLEPPRFMKFHLPYNLTPRSKRAKYIYTIRNPKDTVVSFYKFVTDMKVLDLSFDEYFKCFMNGEVSYGDYFAHVLSWYEHKDEENILLVHYEELCRDVKAQIRRIATFLGECHVTALEDDDLLERIVENTSFNYMKQNLSTTVPRKDVPSTDMQKEEIKINFFRKGTTGDWRNYLSPEQSRLLDERIKAKLGSTEMIDVWKDTI